MHTFNHYYHLATEFIATPYGAYTLILIGGVFLAFALAEFINAMRYYLR